MTTQLRTERIATTPVFTLDGPNEYKSVSTAVCAAGVEALAQSLTEYLALRHEAFAQGRRP